MFYKHRIELTDHNLAYRQPYHLPFAHREIVKKEEERIVAATVIELILPYTS